MQFHLQELGAPHSPDGELPEQAKAYWASLSIGPRRRGGSRASKTRSLSGSCRSGRRARASDGHRRRPSMRVPANCSSLRWTSTIERGEARDGLSSPATWGAGSLYSRQCDLDDLDGESLIGCVVLALQVEHDLVRHLSGSHALVPVEVVDPDWMLVR